MNRNSFKKALYKVFALSIPVDDRDRIVTDNAKTPNITNQSPNWFRIKMYDTAPSQSRAYVGKAVFNRTGVAIAEIYVPCGTSTKEKDRLSQPIIDAFESANIPSCQITTVIANDKYDIPASEKDKYLWDMVELSIFFRRVEDKG